MASEPSKTDILTIFKRLRSIPTNKQCFDCGAKNPTWASVTYGVFLCIDCSATHRSLGVHLTFIRSTQLDTSWTWLQLRAMQLGGNANATAFFRQHGCTTSDSQQKYNSRAAAMYREKLHSMALRAMQVHGTKMFDVKAREGVLDVHLDSAGTPKTPEQKEVDFFAEHEDLEAADSGGGGEMSLAATLAPSQPVPIANGSSNGRKPKTEGDELSGAPSVDAALSMSPTEAVKVAEPRKSTIGARKPASAKKGLGGKKGGLGAQRVRTNFKDIESAAEEQDKQRQLMESNRQAQLAKQQEENDRSLASMKLAYQEMSVDEKKRDQKMKNLDPKKQEQVDRLGMGLGGGSAQRGGVSHSVLNDMQVIEQEKPTRQTKSSRDEYFGRVNDSEYDIPFQDFRSGPPKYDDSPFGSSSSKRKDDLGSWDMGSKSSSSSNWDMDLKSSSSTVESIPSRKPDEDKGRSRKTYEVSDSSEAQKKFGGAKAISSDAFFGKNDADMETRQQLAKFEGQQSISSADFYGNGPGSSGGGGGRRDDYYNTGPDLQDLRDGMKQSVTKVAGRLSNIANGIVSSLQDNYG